MELLEVEEMLKQWRSLLEVLAKQFDEKPTLEVVLFLIGVEELGQIHRQFSKDEKQDLIHIAICRVLSPFGYYIFEGKDKDGWPIWNAAKEMPYMNLSLQSRLMRQGIIKYFREKKMEF